MSEPFRTAIGGKQRSPRAEAAARFCDWMRRLIDAADGLAAAEVDV